ncbi:MAG: hypothetical protein N2Z72_02535 [Bacteroidales bacterium]|nr:hypothetical protein [Bacteroidales bacterium]
MKNFFLKDNFFFGVLLSFLITGITYGLLYLITHVFFARNFPILQPGTMLLIAIAINLIPFRYYLVKLKFDKTGRGIFLVTFIFALFYLYLYM